MNLENIKKTFFKVWDRTGIYYDSSFLSAYGITPEIKKNLNKWIDEWYGKEYITKIFDEIFFSKKIHKVEDCGSYNFTFKVEEFMVDEDSVIVNVEVLDGTMSFIFSDDPDRVWKLSELGNYPDIHNVGWEVDNEIAECITDYFANNYQIYQKFGKTIDVGHWGLKNSPSSSY